MHGRPVVADPPGRVDPPSRETKSPDRRRIESAIERALDDLTHVLPPRLSEVARTGVASGGKRLRPMLTVAAYEEVGGPPTEPVYDLAASVELIHAYSLMHDDLPCMDDAPLRRGVPTPHVVHGVGSTALAGAALIPWAAARALEAASAAGRSPSEAARIAERLLEAAGAGGMIGGQFLDLLAEGRTLGEEELAALHGLKTGALLSASLEVGAMAAGAGDDLLSAVSAFGRRLGLAFQVMDDVLDATASSDVLGKQPSDVAMAKSTYVALLGVEGARRRGRQLAARAEAALDAANLAAPRLRQLARFVVDRRR